MNALQTGGSGPHPVLLDTCSTKGALIGHLGSHATPAGQGLLWAKTSDGHSNLSFVRLYWTGHTRSAPHSPSLPRSTRLWKHLPVGQVEKESCRSSSVASDPEASPQGHRVAWGGQCKLSEARPGLGKKLESKTQPSSLGWPQRPEGPYPSSPGTLAEDPGSSAGTEVLAGP